MPTTTILTVFIPIWLLGVINIAIYFQKTEFKDRIANLSLVILAYMAFFPTIRDKIPPSPNFTIIDIILYALLLTSLLSLISSGYTDGKDDWGWYRDPLFIISAAIVILTALIVIVLLTIYALIWNPEYNKEIIPAEEDRDMNFPNW
jgi:hypothetical protein